MIKLNIMKDIVGINDMICSQFKDDKKFINRDINLNKKIKSVKYTQEKFCDRFLKK